MTDLTLTYDELRDVLNETRARIVDPDVPYAHLQWARCLCGHLFRVAEGLNGSCELSTGPVVDPDHGSRYRAVVLSMRRLVGLPALDDAQAEAPASWSVVQLSNEADDRTDRSWQQLATPAEREPVRNRAERAAAAEVLDRALRVLATTPRVGPGAPGVDL